MQRHNLSVFSLFSGAATIALGIVLLSTDGRFSSYDFHWVTVGLVAAGAVGVLLVVAAGRRITAERRIQTESGFAADE